MAVLKIEAQSLLKTQGLDKSNETQGLDKSNSSIPELQK